jgi:type IV pilus assembly protein PilY1
MNTSSEGVNSRLPLLLMASLLTLASVQSHAAPGPLSKVPLFLAQGVQPNILFLLDNSGSMKEEVLMSVGAIEVHGIYIKVFFPDGTSKDYNQNQGILDFDPPSQTVGNTLIRKRLHLNHCVGYNVLAYDPEYTYTPWYGLDKDGNEFTDADPANARVNPYTGDANSSGSCHDDGKVNNTNGVTCNLLTAFNDGNGAFYYKWTDDGDGVYENGECGTADSDRVYISTLTASQQTNFANWFSYYRKRDYVMKRAVSQIIAESRDRLGLAVINNRTCEQDEVFDEGRDVCWCDESEAVPEGELTCDEKPEADNYHITKTDAKHFVGTPVKDMDDHTLPLNVDAKNNKAVLLDNLLGVKPNDETFLRLALKRAGEYFKGNDNKKLFGYSLTDVSGSAYRHSPILSADKGGTCQQNFVVLFSDGYWNGGSPGVGNSDQNAGEDDSNRFNGQSYADDYSNTLADVAMELYKGDLLSSLDNSVPAVRIPKGSSPKVACYDAVSHEKTQECFDLNNAQHLVTFTVAFGVSGTIPATDGSGNECKPLNRTQSLTTQGWPSSCDESLNDGWPFPYENAITTTDDMMHAAWNGRGLFLNAENPKQLIKSLNETIYEIRARDPVSASAVAVNSFNFSAGGRVFQGGFDSAGWSGRLSAYELKGNEFQSALWEAHTELKTMAISDRALVTYNGSKGVSFNFPSNYQTLGDSDISSVQVDDLLSNAPYPGSTDADEIAQNQAYGEKLVAYLKGNTSNEGVDTFDFRQRNGHRLGDIVHSSPVYVGDPDPDLYPESIAASSYQVWANNTTTNKTAPGAKGRQAMLYVGANDGALHAFNADTGAEVFAYYPKAVFSDEEDLGLHWLADPDYDHRYYVDIEPAVAEVYTNTANSTATTWRTLLVGGLRGGGRAMYAIDVSKPSQFTDESDNADATGVASNILWEFTHPDLGYTYSKPTIAKLNDGRWAAIFGNGYNPTGTDATGQAALFIKYLDNNTPSEYVIYTKAGKITNGDCENAGSNCNGLSTPAVVDLGADRVADRVYAGDLLGNLWAFDLSSVDRANWKVAYGTADSPQPLITANYTEGASSLAQPITAQPIVTMHPTARGDDTRPNTMVFFGTGQYVGENDPTSTGTNSFYGVYDSGASINFDRNATSPLLVQQFITEAVVSGEKVRLLSSNSVDYSTDKGWYVDLPTSGERVVVSPVVYGDLVVYTTLVPPGTLCSDSQGYSWLMLHKLANGAESDYIALDVDGDGVYDSDDQTTGGGNVGGLLSDSIIWQPTLVEGPNGKGRLLLPGGDSGYDPNAGPGIDIKDLAAKTQASSRSSWGILRLDD